MAAVSSPTSSSSSGSDSNSQDETRQTQTPNNVFRNDGSFMEMFKKMQEDQKRKEKEEPTKRPSSAGSPTSKDPPPKKPALSFVGKRRGGRILATGMVKKQRREAVPEKPKPVEGGKTDAWSQYMSEVRKYKEQSCEEEGKRRPLVK
ncbi:telomerase RNA component interacting RNase-like [Eriocheir sinensis]|uniref:telomerase RNA component interacting RNase-like n=1 Tax=Eriocheir sinensis TaxID=95602 RepID=UPI0021C7C5F3|nr:telomerase RNA component interacting RNase-like [Eriocheir sinensis]